MNARMKQFLRTSLFTALVLCTGGMLAPLAAQDISGHWILSVNLDTGGADVSFVFEVDGETLSGTYAGTLGEAPITGTIVDNIVTFSFELEGIGVISYTGLVEGDTMTGECDYGLVGAGTFQGTKQGG